MTTPTPIEEAKYAFDVNIECYCSLCERHYKNYARFVIHMKKVHYPQHNNTCKEFKR